MDHIVIVGASLAGLRAAETLRTDGFVGTITLVGDEARRPYDRPPLSKQVLRGDWDAERVALPGGANEALDLTWELGASAVGLDLAARQVALGDGRTLAYDGLVIACGAAPRMIPGTEDMAGVHALRTLDDALAVRDALDAGATRVLVVGAGFIGAEVAASCRERGVEVTMVEPLPAPLARVLGAEMGAVVADVHRDHGVDLRLDTGVASIDAGSPLAVHLTDGTTVAADLVVVGIGVIPNTQWLQDSGLTLEDGVLCDATTLAAPGVVACGDVARWPNELYDEVMRVEHWEHALDMGAHAARRLLAGDGPGDAFAPVPFFWSDQYDRKIQLAGRVRPTDDIAMVAGSLEDRRFCALYGRDGKVVGALTMNMPAKVIRYRRAIAEGLGWDDALAAAAAAP
ncbi:NAD(P)/FAD-dependent oxidoreductase [Aquihabitans sp. McL0605]|uniref:NAD(P)/FAD-dependent oxidoreductase n=1 Tax=Aquihabitans sp. McL0605 TaxID=3415671 RepID=UPI003CEC142F